MVHHNQMNGSYGINSIQETALLLRRKSASELGAGVSQNASNVSFINLVESIRSERLATLPHKGGRWDKVLIRALYFAEQLHGFESAVQGFAAGNDAAGQIGYGHARLLLEVSDDFSCECHVPSLTSPARSREFRSFRQGIRIFLQMRVDGLVTS